MRIADSIEVAGGDHEPSLLSVILLIVWLLCLGVGILGLVIPYARSRPPIQAPPPVQAEMLEVQLTHESVPRVEPPPRRLDLGDPPPLQAAASLPMEPPRLDLAVALPAADFVLPSEHRATVVKSTAPVTSSANAVAETSVSAPVAPVRTLTFGQGEGKQPAPEYPRRAVREGQEGTVTIRFHVDVNGRVGFAAAATPCAWPLLNEAALRVVRERWRFPAGNARLYEVSIRFELKK